MDRLAALCTGAFAALDDRRLAGADETGGRGFGRGGGGVAACVLIDAFAVAGAVTGLVHAAVEGGKALRNGLGLGRPDVGWWGCGVDAGGVGGVVVGIRDDSFGVKATVDVECTMPPCRGGAPVIEVGGAARFGEGHEGDLEIAVVDELVEAGKIVKERVEGLGRLF